LGGLDTSGEEKKKRKRGNPENVYKEWSPSPYKLGFVMRVLYAGC
jgi:hypothetical protein